MQMLQLESLKSLFDRMDNLTHLRQSTLKVQVANGHLVECSRMNSIETNSFKRSFQIRIQIESAELVHIMRKLTNLPFLQLDRQTRIIGTYS